jgi:hypothetical protein
MAVTIKNPTLHKVVFRKIDDYDSKAIKCYEKGDMKCGKRWEKKSDDIYKKNYKKMFKITKN